MKTLIEIKFDKIIKEGFHDILKPLGFKKKRYNFHLKLQDLGQIINIQKSDFSTKDSIDFTINIGLFIPEFWLTYYSFHNGEIPDFPTEPVCAIRQRIGQMKYNHDTWYNINQESNFDDLITEMKDNLINYILPYFEKAKSKDEIITLLANKNIRTENLGRLIIYGEFKRFDKAQEEYKQLRNDKYINRAFGNDLTIYKEKYNLQD